jgi:uncharacterized protein (TIGR02145 family)
MDIKIKGDGYIYNGYECLRIGNLLWMSKNLGTDNENPYGKYYNWEAAMAAVPEGWRLPTGEDFDALEANFRDDERFYLALSAQSLDENVIRFNAQYGGYYHSGHPNGNFNIDHQSYMWGSTKGQSGESIVLEVNRDYEYVTTNWFPQIHTLNVRCVADWRK